jgi:hypothetical protein
VLPQSTTEALLLTRLGELGGAVRRGHVVEQIIRKGHDYLVRGDGELDLPAEPDRACVNELLSLRRVPARAESEPLWSSRFRVHLDSRSRVSQLETSVDAGSPSPL